MGMVVDPVSVNVKESPSGRKIETGSQSRKFVDAHTTTKPASAGTPSTFIVKPFVVIWRLEGLVLNWKERMVKVASEEVTES